MTGQARYLDDFAPGETFVTGSRVIGESEIERFADLTGDDNPVHTDAEFAASTPFGERIAHGLLGLSMVPGLVARLGIFDGTAVAVLGIESWTYHLPIRIGDELRVRLTITSVAPTSDGRRGVVGRRYELLNQNDEIVQSGSMPILMRRR
jgi:acyl dehydratase